jgi:hypothetical protein
MVFKRNKIFIISFSLMSLFLKPAIANEDPSFRLPPKIGASSGSSWNDPKETIFFCFGVSENNKAQLHGTEFSYRSKDQKSATGACNNLILISHSIISGSKLKNKKWNEGKVTQYWSGVVDKDPVNYLLLNTADNKKYGWYVTNSSNNNFFSEGTFGPPLSNLPKSGIASYQGVIGYSNQLFAKNINVANINFSKNEIEIMANFVGYDGFKRKVESIGPIKFNAENGTFIGKVTSTTYAPGAPYKSSGMINGFVGGANAEVLHASINIGSAFKGGIDFVLGKKR